MAAQALKSLTKAAGVAITKAQVEAFDAVHALLLTMDVDSAVVQAIDELKAKFTAGKPKRAKTGYNLFIAEHMHETKGEQPDLKSVDHMKLACAAWKGLDDDEQERYRGMARELVSSSEDDAQDVQEEVVKEVPVAVAEVAKAKPKPKAKKAAVKKIKKVEEVVIEEEADAE